MIKLWVMDYSTQFQYGIYCAMVFLLFPCKIPRNNLQPQHTRKTFLDMEKEKK